MIIIINYIYKSKMTSERNNLNFNNNKIMDIYNELLNTFEVIVNIIILFLSTTKLLRVMLLSGIITLVLHVGYNEHIKVIKMGRYITDYYWFDIVLTISILTILSMITLMIKEAVDEIDKKFEHLKNTIRKKEIIIEELNTKLKKNKVE
jgi:hypothetical protein